MDNIDHWHLLLFLPYYKVISSKILWLWLCGICSNGMRNMEVKRTVQGRLLIFKYSHHESSMSINPNKTKQQQRLLTVIWRPSWSLAVSSTLCINAVWSLTCCSEGFPSYPPGWILFSLQGLRKLSMTLLGLHAKTFKCCKRPSPWSWAAKYLTNISAVSFNMSALTTARKKNTNVWQHCSD